MKAETILLGAVAIKKFNDADAAAKQALVVAAPGVPALTVAAAQTEKEALTRESAYYGLGAAALLGLAFYMR